MISSESQIAAANVLIQLQKYLNDLPSTIEVREYSETCYKTLGQIGITLKIKQADNDLVIIWSKNDGPKSIPPGETI